MKQNTILQDFEWELPADGQHWKRTAERAEELAALGFTELWLPPAYKGSAGANDVGYGVYDLYDLGEFDQKGTIATKYGTRQDYLKAIRALQKAGIRVLADIVLNHKMGADGCEQVEAVTDEKEDRTRTLDPEHPIEAWTKFTFPGRKGKYSDFVWDHTHFDGVDYDSKAGENGIYCFAGKQWDDEVDKENGNYDYLMGADLDMSNPAVIEELDRWGRWYLDTTGVDGFRLDAVKHIRFTFFLHWLTKLRRETGKALPAVGEYWFPEVEKLEHYLDCCGGVMSLFDVPLHFHLQKASSSDGNFDMTQLWRDTLSDRRPTHAVTFVDNHDTQPGQALESWVGGWFKAQAYALILLGSRGTPCVFYGDLYGIPHDDIAPVPQLPALLWARQNCAWGEETPYFNDNHIVGWTRSGIAEVPGSGAAVVLSDGPAGEKTMCMGADWAGRVMVDLLEGQKTPVTLDEAGCGLFPVGEAGVSVWVTGEAKRNFTSK